MVLPPPPLARKVRKHLSADALYTLVREGFAKIPDHRDPRSGIPLADALMSAFAMFSLKDPSLLAFDQRRSDANLKALFGIGQIPSDTQMREILDAVDPEHLRDSFGDVFRQLQRGKALEPFAFYAGHYLLSPDGTCRKRFTWITDLHVTLRNAWLFARGGRARWRIENETFNTLKNQGYHYEHNYGHGLRNLSVVFAMLMMLAFLVDQAQQLCCPLFRAVWQKLGSKRALWDNLRSHFRHFRFRSMRHLYEVILYDLGREVPVPAWDSS